VLLMVVLYNIILLGLVSVLEGFAALTHADITPLLALVPSLPVLYVAMNASLDGFKDLVGWYLMCNTVVVAVFLLSLLWISRRYFREVFAVFRSNATSSTTPDRAPESAVTPP
jgi:hypothetical protein